MTIRTFKQLGIAFGSQPANITAKINDVIVYQGPVTTLNELIPQLPNTTYTITNELFSWTVPAVSFSGNQVIEISVDNNATLLVGELEANYSEMIVPQSDPPRIVSSGPNTFIGQPWEQFGNTYINGTLQSVNHTQNLGGMWWWQLLPGGTFVENFNVLPGLE